jgi:hypothetical protein
VDDPEGVAKQALARVGDAETARSVSRVLKKKLVRLPIVSPAPDQLDLAQDFRKCLTSAGAAAKAAGDAYLGVDHLLLATLEAKDVAACLQEAGVARAQLAAAVTALRGTGRVDTESGDQQFEALLRYGQSLTDRAAALDPVIGRDEEIRRVVRVLCRRTKNNPVLIGEPGVGKTAIAEGLAQRIVRGDVPDALRGVKLISLDMASLVAGAKYRGEFEERLTAVLKVGDGWRKEGVEAGGGARARMPSARPPTRPPPPPIPLSQEVKEAAGTVILFIDEIHTVIGAGKAEGSMDAGNMLKPMLARGELHCIGATTLSEYRAHIEKDPAFERRFQQVGTGSWGGWRGSRGGRFQSSHAPPPLPGDGPGAVRRRHHRHFARPVGEGGHGVRGQKVARGGRRAAAAAGGRVARRAADGRRAHTPPPSSLYHPHHHPIHLIPSQYSSFHGVRIADRALVVAAELSSRYIADRFLPDKAIDLIDEACAAARVALDSAPEELDRMQRNLYLLNVESAALAKEKDDPAAVARLDEVNKEIAALRNTLQPLQAKYESEKERLSTIRRLAKKRDEARTRSGVGVGGARALAAGGRGRARAGAGGRAAAGACVGGRAARARQPTVTPSLPFPLAPGQARASGGALRPRRCRRRQVWRPGRGRRRDQSRDRRRTRRRHADRGGGPRRHRGGRVALDRDSRLQAGGDGAAKAAHAQAGLAQARRGPGRRGRRGG